MIKSTLIKSGTVVDPAQAIEKITNIYIEDGKIVELTDESPNADLEIGRAHV